jgi:TPR repeat protein
MLAEGERILMNKSLTVYYWKLSADQRRNPAQEMHATVLLSELKDQERTDADVEHSQGASDHDLISAQLRFATLLRQERIISQDLRLSIYYFPLATDQGSVEDQFDRAVCLLRGD